MITFKTFCRVFILKEVNINCILHKTDVTDSLRIYPTDLVRMQPEFFLPSNCRRRCSWGRYDELRPGIVYRLEMFRIRKIQAVCFCSKIEDDGHVVLGRPLSPVTF